MRRQGFRERNPRPMRHRAASCAIGTPRGGDRRGDETAPEERGRGRGGPGGAPTTLSSARSIPAEEDAAKSAREGACGM